MSMKPFVSIIIPCYNSEDTVLESIQSALNQSYEALEIIVVDDGSIDSTLQVLTKSAEENSVIRVISKANGGLSSARNAGIEHANGEYVVCLDSDDLLSASYVSTCLSYFQEDPSLNIVYSNMEMFEREVGIVNLPTFDIENFLVENCIPAFAMVRLAQLKAIGGFDEQVDFCEDWECWMHLIKVFGIGVYRIEEPLYKYRKRLSENSIMDTNKGRSGDDVLLYLFNKHYSLYNQYGYVISNMMRLKNREKERKFKYYNVWYRKLVYKLLKPARFRNLMEELS